MQKGYKKNLSIKYSIIVMMNDVIYKYLNMTLPDYEKCKSRISDEDFFIPNIGEHYVLFKYNYTVLQLKQMCKKYKLPRTGGKNILMLHIYNYLYYSYYASKIQKHMRGYLQRKLNSMRGPAYLKREKCVNDCDFFSLTPTKEIDAQQFFSYEDQDGFIYGFDILSLWQLFEKGGAIENPYNRQAFPENIREILEKLVKLNKRGDSKINISLKDTEVDLEKELELRIVNLFQFINALGHYTDHAWFLGLDRQKLVRYCRELYDIWNHRAQISEEVKARIYPNGNPFRMVNYNSFSLNSTYYDLRKSATNICENLCYYGITDDDKNMGAYYILTALTLQSAEAAHAMPWLYQSVM